MRFLSFARSLGIRLTMVCPSGAIYLTDILAHPLERMTRTKARLTGAWQRYTDNTSVEKHALRVMLVEIRQNDGYS
jgi:hypothetical protein